MTVNQDIPKEMLNQIHAWALAGAAVAAALPVGTDAVALTSEEVLLVIKVSTHFGIPIDKAAARGILSGLIAGLVGTTVHTAAVVSLESANLGYPLTIPVKAGIAAGIIELVGRSAYRYFEKESCM